MRIPISLFTLVLTSLFASADDWPQWLGPKRDGVWRETGIVEKFLAGGPKVLWRQPCGPGYSSPTVAEGKLYLTDFVPNDGEKLPAGGFSRSRTSGKERLTCRDAATGREAWSLDYPVNTRSRTQVGPG